MMTRVDDLGCGRRTPAFGPAHGFFDSIYLHNIVSKLELVFRWLGPHQYAKSVRETCRWNCAGDVLRASGVVMSH